MQNKIINFVKKTLGFKLMFNSVDFIEKFIEDVNTKHVQMEAYYNGQIIFQIQSLKHVGFWFQCNEIEKEKYKDGFIIFFFLKTRGIEKNAAYINYDKRKEQLDMYEINDLKHNITYFIKFFKKNVNVLDIDTYTKKLIVTVYNFPEKKPKILFNLRYLKN